MDIEIQELEDQAKSLRLELRAIEEKIADLKVDAYKKKFGIDIGDVVSFKGCDYKVTNISPRWGWVTGIKRNKDGEFGRLERQLYDSWERV